MTAAETFAPWPPSAVERDLRAQLDTIHELILAAEARDGRVTACALRLAMGLGPRVRETS